MEKKIICWIKQKLNFSFYNKKRKDINKYDILLEYWSKENIDKRASLEAASFCFENRLNKEGSEILKETDLKWKK